MSLSPIEQRVRSLISGRAVALVEDLRQHVSIPTGHNNTPALDKTRDLLTRRAAALGARVELVAGGARPGWLYREGADKAAAGDVPPTAVCRRDTGVAPGGTPLLIAGHLDTVHDPRGSFRELTIAADGRRGVGPGCADMKGGLVTALAALEALEEAGVRLPWTLLLNSDEEMGSFHSAEAIGAESRRVAAAGGVGVALEPATADGGLVVERAGAAQFVIRARGKAAHVGRDFDKGISAVTLLARAILRAAELTEVVGADGQRALITNIGPLRGGAAANIVADSAMAWGNARIVDEAAARKLATGLDKFCRELSVGGASVTHELVVSRPAKPRTSGVDSLAETARAVAVELGQQLPFTRTAGVCDGNLMQAEGLATLDTLGVRGGGLHTTEEWVDIVGLVERCQLLAVWMMRVCGVKRGVAGGV